MDKKTDKPSLKKSELIDAIAKKTDNTISKAKITEVLDAFEAAVTESLGKGTNVTLVGFLTLKVKTRSSRPGRNPQTGAPINIPAGKTVSIHAGKTLKEYIKNNKKKK